MRLGNSFVPSHSLASRSFVRVEFSTFVCYSAIRTHQNTDPRGLIRLLELEFITSLAGAKCGKLFGVHLSNQWMAWSRAIGIRITKFDLSTRAHATIPAHSAQSSKVRYILLIHPLAPEWANETKKMRIYGYYCCSSMWCDCETSNSGSSIGNSDKWISAAGEQLGNWQLQYKSPFPLILMKISPKAIHSSICWFPSHVVRSHARCVALHRRRNYF